MSVLIGTATAKVVSELILNGKIKEAKERADARVSNDAWFLIEDANFFYWYGKAVRLTSHDERLMEKIRIFMQDCANHTELMECDWLIDEAMDAIRLFNPDLADESIRDFMLELPKANTGYRNAVINMLKGRIAYMRQDFDQAVDCHFIADGIFLSEYRMDNLFYLLKAASANKMSLLYRQQLTDRVIDGDNRRLRRFRAKFINFCPLGNLVDDIFMRLGLV